MSCPLSADPILELEVLLVVVYRVILRFLPHHRVGDGVREIKVLKRINPIHEPTPGVVRCKIVKFKIDDFGLEGVFFL